MKDQKQSTSKEKKAPPSGFRDDDRRAGETSKGGKPSQGKGGQPQEKSKGQSAKH